MKLHKHEIWQFVLQKVGSSSHFKGYPIYEILFKALNLILGIPLPLKIRELFDALQPNDAILTPPYPMITLGIVCHPKDYEYLDLVVSQAIKHSINQINQIIMVTTSDGVQELSRRFPFAEVKDENLFLDPKLIMTLRTYVPNNIYGWVLQQVAKFTLATTSRNDATLILDSDTILLRDRVFIGADGRQSISYSYEYHMPYAEHFSKFSNCSQDSTGHSFVTHFQLMQKKYVNLLFADVGLSDWIKSANYRKFSPLADYHSYGEFMCRNYPNLLHLVRWGNISIKSEKIANLLNQKNTKELYKNFAKWNSISIHSYL